MMQKSSLCPNITHLNEIFEDEKKIYLIMDYCEGGDLMEFLIRKGPLSLKDSRIIMRQLLLVLDFIHNIGILHRDLKPQNILLSNSDPNSLEIKLSDFGFS